MKTFKDLDFKPHRIGNGVQARMDAKTYTQKEITSALNILKNDEEKLLSERKGLNQMIREKRKNIKYYEELDLRQYKAF